MRRRYGWYGDGATRVPRTMPHLLAYHAVSMRVHAFVQWGWVPTHSTNRQGGRERSQLPKGGRSARGGRRLPPCVSAEISIVSTEDTGAVGGVLRGVIFITVTYWFSRAGGAFYVGEIGGCALPCLPVPPSVALPSVFVLLGTWGRE